MSDEEKKALERIEDFLTTNIIVSISNDETADSEELKAFISKNEYLAIEFIASMFLKQSKEIEHQKEKRENQKKELAILNAKQIEFNKLVNTVNSYKGQFKRQQKEIEELKEKNKKLKDKAKELIFEKQELTSGLLDSTPNDKIKAKIDYLLKQYDSENFINFEMFIKILQSLLDKE